MSNGDPFDLLREHIDDQFVNVHRRMDDRHAEVIRRIDGIDRTLDGNGSPGLVKLVDRHKQRFETMDKDTGRIASRHGGVWGAVGGVLGGVVVAVLAYFGVKTQ